MDTGLRPDSYRQDFGRQSHGNRLAVLQPDITALSGGYRYHPSPRLEVPTGLVIGQ